MADVLFCKEFNDVLSEVSKKCLSFRFNKRKGTYPAPNQAEIVRTLLAHMESEALRA